MKKYFFLIVASLCSLLVGAQSASQLNLHDFAESKTGVGTQSLLSQIRAVNWPKDIDGDQDCALIRITFENMTADDANDVTLKLSNSSGLKEKRIPVNAGSQNIIWYFVNPTSSTFIEAVLSKYGTSNRLSNIKLEPKHTYDVVLTNKKTHSISITTNPPGFDVMLENGQRAVTPATITGVAPGMHTLKISKNGSLKKSVDIEVSEMSVNFSYDLRETKQVRFVSDPSNALLLIDGKEMGETPITLTLPYDSYNVEAVISPLERDSKAITIDALSPNEIQLEPIQKKTFEVYAMYNGRKVDADLYINGKREPVTQSSYSITRPIGKTYNMTMTYYGNSKSRKIHVTKDMSIEQEFKIKARNSINWPWQREYQPAPVGINFGYVRKHMVTQGNGTKFSENGVWDDGKDKWLNGLECGVHFQPCLSWGLGFYSALNMQIFLSSGELGDYDEFQEYVLNIPVHALFRLPVGEKYAIWLHGGLGFDISLWGAYTDSDNYYEDYTDFYGEDAFPKRFNMTADIGFNLRLNRLLLSAQFSKGLIDHGSYHSISEDYKTKVNKMSFSISYLFSSGE